MRADRPRSAAVKGSLDYMGAGSAISIPVFLYRKDSEVKRGGLESHLYHRGECEGRVRYSKTCEVCEVELQSEDIVKLVEIGDKKLEIEDAEVKGVLGPEDTTLQILQSIPLTKVAGLMSDNIAVPNAIYAVRPFRAGAKREPMPVVEKQLRVIFDALAKAKSALYVKVPLKTGERMGLLMPSGDIFTLYFEEELREDIPLKFAPGEGYERDNLNVITTFVKGIEGTLTQPPSMEDKIAAVEDLLVSKGAELKAYEDAPKSKKAKKDEDALDDFFAAMAEAIK